MTMCVNYKPTDAEMLEALSGLSPIGLPAWRDQIWQDYDAPIILSRDGGGPALAVASYGMIPKDKMPPDIRMTTLNARAETIGEKRSYAGAWRAAQTCLVPAMAFYEPNWESGKAERWEIGMADGSPFYIAGLWRAWDDGSWLSFTQITVKADEHPLMRHFHKPTEEKRSLVIIPRDQAEDWLEVGDPEIARAYLQLYPAELMAAAPAVHGYGRKKSA